MTRNSPHHTRDTSTALFKPLNSLLTFGLAFDLCSQIQWPCNAGLDFPNGSAVLEKETND